MDTCAVVAAAAASASATVCHLRSLRLNLKLVRFKNVKETKFLLSHLPGHYLHILFGAESALQQLPRASSSANSFGQYTSYIRGTYAMESVALVEIADVVEQQRRIIQKEMEDYVYPNGKYDVYANKLDDLVIEKQGNPLRSVILTTWRSGSTFLGDILNSHPANFYHYEPLLHFGIIQIRDPPLSDEALENLDSMFKCDYSSLERYLSFGRNSHPWVFNHNTYLWKQCQLHKRICWDNRFVTKFCKLFPFQSMKIVRLRLQPMEKFLEQNEVIRYEDLSVDPYSHTEKLFEFYGLHFHENVQRFLDTHTKTDIGGLSSTFRNSKAAPFHWRNDLDFEEVEEIQQECNLAMKLWGYVFALNETHQRYFDPVTNYSLRDSEA
ncbi:PREDICTED: carbohydrate sulfotransferase 4-like isoform X7 [Ceratosolen solmsi marchali]|uniref:Carbohydrate sulfotransferase 4-like isoform X7 n=1 Tax=Ceratosolen solmsi marchali TaxID=326594 RepID=A0AAJ6YPD3_9HYME|nr:PREDICTED: carbohydrate sulfotransferase 4-like isoform X7 [Ceratosolen solmsi marchali]